MRVLSPRMLPPDTGLDGSTLSTATRSPRSRTRCTPSASINVLLPTPGTPVIADAPRPSGVRQHRVEQRRRQRPASSARSLSTSVIARASVGAIAARGRRRCTARDGQARARQAASGGTRGSRPGDRGSERADRDRAARTEHGRDAGRFERRHVGRRDDAADDDQDVRPPELAQCRDQLRHQQPVSAGQGRRRRRTCTSLSTAMRAASCGVWNSGPTSTSKPRSAKAEATTRAPRSWPSWPSLTTGCAAGARRARRRPRRGRGRGRSRRRRRLLRPAAPRSEDTRRRSIATAA